MTHGHVAANHGGAVCVTVEHCVVLDVGARSHVDGTLIPPEHGPVPDAGGGLHRHAAHQGGIGGQPGGRVDDGRMPAKALYHVCWFLSLSTVISIIIAPVPGGGKSNLPPARHRIAGR